MLLTTVPGLWLRDDGVSYAIQSGAHPELAEIGHIKSTLSLRCIRHKRIELGRSLLSSQCILHKRVEPGQHCFHQRHSRDRMVDLAFPVDDWWSDTRDMLSDALTTEGIHRTR